MAVLAVQGSDNFLNTIYFNFLHVKASNCANVRQDNTGMGMDLFSWTDQYVIVFFLQTVISCNETKNNEENAFLV